MKTLIDIFITWILLLVGFISSHLSIQKRNKFGCFIGNLLRVLSKKREIIARDNIRIALPDSSDELINRIVNKSYHNLGIITAEVSAMKTFDEESIRLFFKFNNLDLLINKYNEGKGLILLSGHYGNWELLAYSVGMYTKIPILIIVKPQKNIYSDKILNNYRTKGGNSVISMYQAARGIINTLQSGGAIAMLADQSATSDKDIYVDFFGKPTATYKAPAELALKFNIPVICSFPIRKEDCTYEANIIELKHDDLENNDDGIYVFTKRYAGLLEQAIRQNPELWVWQHRRWKHSF